MVGYLRAKLTQADDELTIWKDRAMELRVASLTRPAPADEGACIASIWEQARENHEAYSATGEAEQDLRFLTLGLVGEAGELANFVKKRWRDGGALNDATGDYLREECRKEVADVLAYTMMVAQRLGMTPSDLIETVAEKQKVFVAKMAALRAPGEA